MQMHYIEIAEDLEIFRYSFILTFVFYDFTYSSLVSLTILTLFLVVEHAKVGGIA